MVTIGLDEARAGVEGLLDRVERGGDVPITREPPPSQAADHATMEEALRRLAKFRDSQPPWSAPSADLLREMRDEGY